MQKLLLISLFLVFVLNGFSQFEYRPLDFDANNSDYYSFSYQSKIYNIDRDNILREIDEFSGEISEYSIHTGFPIRGSANHYQVDSFLVILNGERSTLKHSGALVFNMNSKEQKFYSWVDYLPDFTRGESYEVGPFGDSMYLPASISISTSDLNVAIGDGQLYIFGRSHIDTLPTLLKLNPATGFDLIKLTELAAELDPEEFVKSFKSSESIMAVYTSSNRVIFWDIQNTANMSIVPFVLGETPYFYEAKGHKFPFSTNSNVHGIIDTTGNLRNFSDEFNLPNSLAGTRTFVGDSLCLSYQTDNNLIIIDTTENVKVVKSISNFDISGNIIGVSRHSDNESLLLKMHIPSSDIYQPSTYKLNRYDSITSIKTTPLENIRDYYQSYGFINKNNDLFILGSKSYAVNTGNSFSQYLLSDSELTAVGNGNLTIHKFFVAEDFEGNVYGQIYYSYSGAQSYLNKSYYIKVDALTYEYSMVTQQEFNSVILDQTAVVSEAEKYIIFNGVLSFEGESAEQFKDYLVEGDSLEKVLKVNDRLFCFSFNTVYELDMNLGSLQKLQSFETGYALNDPSYDIMGNVYITTFSLFGGGTKLFRMVFNDSTFQEIIPPDKATAGSGRYMHNWFGNIYIERVYNNFDSIVAENNVINFFNGFEWNNSNSINENLPFSGWSYRLRSAQYSNRVILERTQSRYVEVICPTRELNELQSVYYLRDSILPAEVLLNSDVKDAFWSNSTKGVTTKIYRPGSHWVKVLFENGCSQVKEFEVKLLPTQANKNVDVLYDFSSNGFPIIFNEEIEGDFYLYDLKGSKVKEFFSYNNDWIPELEYRNSVMVYGIFKAGKKIQSGKIIFL